MANAITFQAPAQITSNSKHYWSCEILLAHCYLPLFMLIVSNGSNRLGLLYIIDKASFESMH